ncbi:hypothetical protein SAMN05216553_117115 [Lentzea fradiae]|uniref:Uncharacterized protein n=1 Tax=Lentzea fradiae TaxID=200378 RepID=A0A1G8ACR3_9PSEU|nr:hypothetical protein SAMN05216553_117115 [Lentzea fradiae]
MNPWAPPAGPARQRPDEPDDALYAPIDPDPFGAYSGPAPHHPSGGPDVPRPVLDVAPQASAGAGLLIGAGLLVLVVVLGAALLWFAGKDDWEFGEAPAAQAPVPATTSEPKPFAVVGDCVLLSGGSDGGVTAPEYAQTECAENKHNYTVGKTMRTGEKCGENEYWYVRYTEGYGMNVCLIPVYADGECYDFKRPSGGVEAPKTACGSDLLVIRVKVLTGVADTAACPPDERRATAMAYPEINTTYCLSQTFR